MIRCIQIDKYQQKVLNTAMKQGKIIVARIWHRYAGDVPSRAPIILGIEPQRYQTICIYLMKSSEKPNFFEEKGCKVFYISNKKFFRVLNLRAIYKLSKILKREKVDIIHCHRHQAIVYGTIAAKLAGVPVVFAHVHGLNRSKALHRKLTNFIILRFVNKILTVGDAIKEDVRLNNPSVPDEKIVSLSNSIDYDLFAQVKISKQQARKNIGLEPNSFVFGTVGRLVPTKGQSYLIRAFEKTKPMIPSAELILIGDGRLRTELEQQATASTYADSIHFLGHRDNIPELMKAMDIFVLPSVAEGLPRALLEAMAAGVPCISTKAGGIPEIIGNDEYGLVVPPKDENALAEAMIKLANKRDEELKELSEKAQQRVKNSYTHEVVIRRLERLYETCLESN